MDTNNLPMAPSSSVLTDTTRKSRYKKLKNPKQLMMHVCAVCGTTKNLLRCSRCKIIYYCGAAHQYMDWPKHKLYCNKQGKQNVHQNVQTLIDFVENAKSVQSPSLINMTSATNSSIISASPGQLPQESVLYPSSIVSTGISTLSLSLPPPSPPSLKTSENGIPNNAERDAMVEATNDVCYFGNMPANVTSTVDQMYPTVESINTNIMYNIKDATYATSPLNQFDNYENDVVLCQQQKQQPEQQHHLHYQQQEQQQQYYENFLPTGNHSKSVEYLPTSQISTHAINQREKSTSHQIDANIANGLLTECANDRRYEELCRNITNDMNEYGLSVVDDFLGTEKGLQILNEVHRMYAAGVFKDGQLVNKVKSEQDLRTIRGDKITWVKGVEVDCSNIGYLINQIDAVICRANTMKNNGKLGDYVIKERTKAMVACYPGSGAHYVMHVDNPNKDGRVITAIYYLNLNWDAERSGGVLRIFPEQTKSVADIEPKFDRLIFFWSDKRNPHEVQPAHRTRYAITVWYFDANEREAALNRCKNLTTSSNNIVFRQF